MPADPTPLILGLGSKGQNSTLSENGHVAYQIKGNHECSNIVANILPADPTPTLEMGSIGQNSNFSEHDHVAYQIKGKHDCSNTDANILPADPLHHAPDPREMGSIGQKFSEHGHIAYQIKGNHEFSNMVANILPADHPPPLPLGWGQ